jgi:cytochrome P450
LAKSGETVEMVEETWTLAADMVCRALFDRKMPFNPHFVFKAVKTYTDVSSHKSIRLGRQSGELKDISEVDPAKAVETWLSVPEMVLGEDPLTTREHTLMAMLMNAKNDENIPDFDENQVIDELKQYLWAGTETTALTLAWTFYIASQHEDVREKILAEAEEVYGGREPTIEDIQNSPTQKMWLRKHCVCSHQFGHSFV